MQYEKNIFLISFLFVSYQANSEEYTLPPEGINIIGELRLVKARKDETLLDIAREYGVGNDAMTHANPSVDPWYPGEGTPIVIPNRYILPDTPHEGLVLNLPEMRIYYYPKPEAGETPKVVTFPVGIGRMDWQTPLGLTKIIERKKNPTWTPPASIKAEHAAKGDPLDNVIPAGPDNPLGSRALRLGIPGYLIHGTNKPYGVGMRVSHGCVRLRQEDIEALFDMVSVNEKVRIINQPLKISYYADSLFMEFHEPLEEDNMTFEQNYSNALDTAKKFLDKQHIKISDSVIKNVVSEKSGIPVEVSYKKVD